MTETNNENAGHFDPSMARESSSYHYQLIFNIVCLKFTTIICLFTYLYDKKGQLSK